MKVKKKGTVRYLWTDSVCCCNAFALANFLEQEEQGKCPVAVWCCDNACSLRNPLLHEPQENIS
jgi:hypothetical protein